MRNKRSRLGLKLENLESRKMMAGDVDAFAVSKILYITGDELANGVAVVSDGGTGFNVVGLAQGGSATTINKGASQTFTKIKDIVISMGKGDDAVVVSNIYVNGSLYVSGSKGNDVVGLGQFADTGLVDDAVDAMLGALNVKKNVTIDTAEDNDAILARAVAIGKSFVASTGAGNDTVTFDTAGGVGDPGVAVVKDIAINTGTENDTVSFDRTSAKGLTVQLGSDDDDVSVKDSTTTKTATFNGDKGVNSYTDLLGNSFNKLVRKNFQTIV